MNIKTVDDDYLVDLLLDEGHSAGWYQGRLESPDLDDEHRQEYDMLNRDAIAARTRYAAELRRRLAIYNP